MARSNRLAIPQKLRFECEVPPEAARQTPLERDRITVPRLCDVPAAMVCCRNRHSPISVDPTSEIARGFWENTSRLLPKHFLECGPPSQSDRPSQIGVDRSAGKIPETRRFGLPVVRPIEPSPVVSNERGRGFDCDEVPLSAALSKEQ